MYLFISKKSVKVIRVKIAISQKYIKITRRVLTFGKKKRSSLYHVDKPLFLSPASAEGELKGRRERNDFYQWSSLHAVRARRSLTPFFFFLLFFGDIHLFSAERIFMRPFIMQYFKLLGSFFFYCSRHSCVIDLKKK